MYAPGGLRKFGEKILIAIFKRKGTELKVNGIMLDIILVIPWKKRRVTHQKNKKSWINAW